MEIFPSSCFPPLALSLNFRFLICAVCGKDVIRDREDLSAHFRRHRKMTVEDYFAMHASPVASGKGKKV